MKKYGEKYPEISQLAYNIQNDLVLPSKEQKQDMIEISNLVEKFQSINENLSHKINEIQAGEIVENNEDKIIPEEQIDSTFDKIIAELMVNLFSNFEDDTLNVQYFSTSGKLLERFQKHQIFAGLSYLAAGYLDVVTNGKSSSHFLSKAFGIMNRSNMRKRLILAYSSHLVFHHQNQNGLKFLKLILKRFNDKGLSNKARLRYICLNIYSSQLIGDDIAKQEWLEKYQTLKAN